MPAQNRRSMKIAVLSDIHANLVALTAALEDVDRWSPDWVVFLGDIVNRGPKPLECLQLAQSFAALYPSTFVLGNHEEYVLDQANSAAPPESPQAQVHQASRWTRERLGDATASLVEFLPYVDIPVPFGGLARFVHGSMRATRDGIYAHTFAESFAQRLGLEPEDSLSAFSLFCVGHTHRAFISQNDHVQVVNAGSVGLPFDGDRRLGYARLTWKSRQWQVELRRLPYDLLQAEFDFYTTQYLTGAGPLAQLVLIELLTASSQLYQWARDYQDQVLSGEISMLRSVMEHIYRLHNPGYPVKIEEY